MKVERMNTSGISMNCLERMIRFMENDMAIDEVLTFAAHFQECFECRDLAGATKEVVEWRENIQKLNHREALRQER